MAPLVTVAMSVHNGASTLGPAVRSLLWQTFTEWELLVINDASTDDTLHICRQFQDSRIQVIDEPQQRGLAARLNQCVDRARGKYMARMDADDVAYPERFLRQVEYLESHPEIDLLGHGAVLFRGDGEIIGLYPMAECHEDICRRPWWGFPLAHPTWMGKRSWFLKHRYDETLTKAQDQDLLLRTWRTSRFACLPECLLGYRLENVSVSKSVHGRWAYCRRLLVQAKDIPSAVCALRGIGVHTVALARDLMLDLTGVVGRRVRQSYIAADLTAKEQWRSIWDRVSADQPSCVHV